MRFIRSSPIACLLAVGIAGGVMQAPGQEESAPVAGASRVVSSAHRRFLVVGLDRAAAVGLAVAAEDAAARLEAIVGRPLPFFKNQPVVMAARRLEGPARGRLIRSQGWTEQGMTQKLEIINAGQVGQEDLLEALCWLLVNRYASARQTPAQRRARLAEAPDWLSAGLAQNLYPSLRERNSRMAWKQQQAQQAMKAADILALRHLPDGRWREKAFCGLMVDWLLSFPADRRVWSHLMDAVASSSPVTAEWLAGVILEKEDPQELEKQWAACIEQQKLIQRLSEPSQADPAGELEMLLRLRTRDWPDLASLQLPDVLVPAQWIGYRNEKWMPAVVRHLEAGLQMLGRDGDSDFRPVLDAYADFLEALALRQSAVADAAVLGLLRAADRELAKYRALVQARRRFVDEAEGNSLSRTPASEAGLPRLPRSELQRYVDSAEEKTNP